MGREISMKRLLRRYRLWQICRACGIKRLYKRQLDVLLSGDIDSLWEWGRASGKTITACLYTLLYQKEPIKLSRTMLSPAIKDPDGHINGHVGRFVTDEFIRMHTLCRRAGVKVCDIYLMQPMWSLDRGYYQGGYGTKKKRG